MPLDKAYLCLDGIKRNEAGKRRETFSDLVAAIGIAFSGKGFKEHIDLIGE